MIPQSQDANSEPFNPLKPTSTSASEANGADKNSKYGGYIDKAIKAQLNNKI